MLRDVLAPRLGAAGALMAWTGPSGTAQDFQFGRAAIEVRRRRAPGLSSYKFTASVSSTQTGVDALFLVVVTFDTRQAGPGQTLPGLIDALRSEPHIDSAVFDDKLLNVGYDDLHRNLYDTIRYTARDIGFYNVAANFPRLVESGLPNGLGHVTYRIATSACESYRCAVGDL